MKELTSKSFKDARKYAKKVTDFSDWCYEDCKTEEATLVGRIVTVSAKTPDAPAQVLLVTETTPDYTDCYCLVNQENEVIAKIHKSGDPIEMIEDIEEILNLHLISNSQYEAEGEYTQKDGCNLYCNTNATFEDEGFPDYD